MSKIVVNFESLVFKFLLFILGYGMVTSNQAYWQTKSNNRLVAVALWTKTTKSLIKCMGFCMGKFSLLPPSNLR